MLKYRGFAIFLNFVETIFADAVNVTHAKNFRLAVDPRKTQFFCELKNLVLYTVTNMGFLHTSYIRMVNNNYNSYQNYGSSYFS